MYDDTLFWVSIIMMALSLSLVLIDWYCMHQKYALSDMPNIVNRVFAFFCLAMLTGNAIMVSMSEYNASVYVSSVVSLTEIFFLVTQFKVIQ